MVHYVSLEQCWTRRFSATVSAASVLGTCWRGWEAMVGILLSPRRKYLLESTKVKQEPSLATFLHTCSKLKAL